jgi:hypothetical protein
MSESIAAINLHIPASPKFPGQLRKIQSVCRELCRTTRRKSDEIPLTGNGTGSPREPYGIGGLNQPKYLAYACLTVLIALYIVGAVSHGSLRHEVQTLPLWFPIVMGLRGRELAKWAALPCLVFWFVIMFLIWLFLLGWAHIVSGHFSPAEIAMTLATGAASIAGTAFCLGWKTQVNRWAATSTVILFAALQLLAFRVSLIPFIANQ